MHICVCVCVWCITPHHIKRIIAVPLLICRIQVGELGLLMSVAAAVGMARPMPARKRSDLHTHTHTHTHVAGFYAHLHALPGMTKRAHNQCAILCILNVQGTACSVCVCVCVCVCVRVFTRMFCSK